MTRSEELTGDLSPVRPSRRTPLDFVLLALIILVTLLVPTVFSAWTQECGYVKNVILAGLVLVGSALWMTCFILGQSLRFRASALDLAVLVYLVAAAASALLSDYPITSMRALWRLAVFVLLYFLLRVAVTTRGRVVVLLASSCVAALLVAGYAFAQRMGHDPVTWSQSSRDRVFSSIGNPNMFAGYLVIMIPLAVGLTLAARSWWLRGLGGLTAAACCVALMFTQTKGAWLAFLAAVAFFVAASLWGRAFKGLSFSRKQKIAGIAAILVVLGVVAVLLRPAVNRFRTTFGDSAKVRLVYWRGACGMFRDAPLVGQGLGVFRIQFPRHRPVGFRAAGVTYNTLHAHSEYLETLAEQGVVGAAALALLIAVLFVVGLRALRRVQAGADRCLLCGLLAAVAGSLSHSVVSVVLRWSVCPTFLWLVLGLVQAMAALSAGEEGPKEYAWTGQRWARALLVLLALLLGASAAQAFVVRPFRAQLLIHQGGRLIKQGKWDEAVRTLQSAINEDPIELRSYYQLAHAYYEKGDYQRAVETYRALQVHAPDFAQIHYNLGVVYTILKQWDAAGDEFALAARMGLIPPEVSVQPLLAQLRKDAKGKGEEKYVAVLREIVRANPEDTFSWNRLGIWHYRKNQLDEASGHFEKALEADDEYIPALNNLAGVYYQRQQYAKAIGICRRILEIDPKSVRTRVNLGRAYYLQGEKEKARNQWHKALEIAPKDAETRSCLKKLQ